MRGPFDKARSASPAASSGAPSSGFPLIHYFTLSTLVAFLAIAAALYFLERTEETFFQQVQNEQSGFFATTQRDLMRRQEADARASLIAVYEVAHINLTRVFANVLWESGFAPLVAAAQSLSVDRCRTATNDPTVTKACFVNLAKKIAALPGFDSLDARAYKTMQNTTVFKIKVFDLRGITIYSSEHDQIGEDKANNLGWQSAARGRAASELTHRDRFSTFEGLVENRDLISSYIPVRSHTNDQVIAVFEIYSDVTPLLEQITEASARMNERATANQRRLEDAGRDNQRKVSENIDHVLLIISGLMALIYGLLWIITRHAQRTYNRPATDREQD